MDGEGVKPLPFFMLITPEYIELNRILHDQRKDYGSRLRVDRWRDVLRYCADGQRILDYGCGKGAMRDYLGDIVTNYDPVTFPENPDPHPVVACLDVMEHIEPDCLEDVLEHISGLFQQVAYFVICKKQGSKKLADGRPAHLIVKTSGWWVNKLSKHFKSVEFVKADVDERNDMTFICR